MNPAYDQVFRAMFPAGHDKLEIVDDGPGSVTEDLLNDGYIRMGKPILYGHVYYLTAHGAAYLGRPTA